MIKNGIRSFVERHRSLASFYRNTRDLLDQRQPPRRTPWGFTLAGHDAMAQGCFEPNETKIARELITQVDMVVNIGANVGYYCCHALSMGRPVIAIEPNSRNLHYLLENIQNNGWANLAEVFPVAMGSNTDILQMWGAGTGASLVKGWAAIPESYVAKVPILTLDRVLGDSLHGKKALIIVDIEGAEFMMLEGAKQTLINDPSPLWIMEISTTEHQPAGTVMNPYFAKTFDFFFSRGYCGVASNAIDEVLTEDDVRCVESGEKKLETHTFLFFRGQ